LAIGRELIQKTEDDEIFEHVHKRWHAAARVESAGGGEVRMPRTFVDGSVSGDVRQLPVTAAGREVAERCYVGRFGRRWRGGRWR